MSTPSTPRGIRNNNPGNIRLGQPWYGLVPSDQQTDPSFCQFTDPIYGIRALGKILCTYNDKYGLNTVQGIINRWAPPNENDTGAYVSNVATLCGVAPTDTVNIHDPSVLALFAKAIIQHENGQQPYSDDIINKGVQLAAI